VFHGPGRKAWEDVPKPEIIDPGDVVVRVDAVTICGTDLHILDAGCFITHHFTHDDFPKAYEVFANAGDTGALKVVLTR